MWIDRDEVRMSSKLAMLQRSHGSSTCQHYDKDYRYVWREGAARRGYEKAKKESVGRA